MVKPVGREISNDPRELGPCADCSHAARCRTTQPAIACTAFASFVECGSFHVERDEARRPTREIGRRLRL